MDSTNSQIICPVCTLYLRPGITLKNHLTSHPKQKVIEALVRLSECEDAQQLAKIDNVPSTTTTSQDSSISSLNTAIVNHQTTWNNQSGVTLNLSPQQQQQPAIQGNHLFIYQQSLSSTSASPGQNNVMNINPLTQQQYIVPTIFNSQMMPYVYQQQQVIMSSSGLTPSLRTLPFELPITPSTSTTSGDNIGNLSINEIENDDLVSRKIDQENEVVIVEGDDDEDHEESGMSPRISTIQIENEIVKVDNKLLLDDDDDEDKYKNDDDDCELKLYENNNDNKKIDDDQDLACLGSPRSVNSDWSLRVRSDLNKACQTQVTNTSTMEEDEEELRQVSDQPDYYFVNSNTNDSPIIYTTTTEINYDLQASNSSPPPPPPPSQSNQTSQIYSSTNLSNDNLVDYIEMDGMQVPINEFSTNQIISQVEHFDNNHRPGSGVLMTIGSMIDNHEDISRSSSTTNLVNIRSDERMPARGELSGQESIGGASDITSWNRLQYNEASSVMSTSYELLVRDNWEQSDNSCQSELINRREDNDIPTTIINFQQQSVVNNCTNNEDEDDDMPTIVSYNPPPLNFKCSTCGKAFKCLKERKEHEQKEHLKNIGNTKKKTVKKLVVKLKSNKTIKTENNFDNVFTNKLKLETTPTTITTTTTTNNQNEQAEGQQPQETLIENVKLDNDNNLELKTICTICDCALANAKALKEHHLKVHNLTTHTRHKCMTCNEGFPNEHKFTEHLRIHPLECKLCGKLFYRKQNLQMHMKRHLGIKPYKCENCEKSFLTRQKFNEHKNTHTGEAPIKCNLCNESFRRHSNLVQHRNRRHFNVKKKIKDYICFCQQVFHSKKKLAWHKETHDSKPKSCTHCSEKFIHMSSLTRHMRRAHNERYLPNGHKNNENVECPICKGVYLKSSLDVHIRTHSGQRPFTCLICNKDFTTKWNLKLHKWTHASRVSKPFKCEHCKGAFIRESDYIAHMNSHKSIRPYTCNYCGAQFIRKYNCQRHVKEHENEKTFTCKACGKSFHRSYYLKDHMRIHSGVRPYACHICGKTSATKSNHNKHMQIHHAREPVSTEN